MKHPIASSALFIATLSYAPFAFAQAAPQKVSPPAQITVGNDLYMAGEQVTLSAPVNSNLNVAGGNITVSTTVAGDLQVIGGEVTVTGGIRDNMRVLGGNVRITGRVNGTLTVVSGQVHIEKTAVIAGGMLVAGGNVTIDGTVNGVLKARAGDITVNGTVNGITELYGDSVTVNGIVGGNATVSANSFVVGSTASFRGKLDYWSQQGQQTLTGRVLGVASFKPALAPQMHNQEDAKAAFFGILGAMSLFSLFSGALTIGLFLFLTKNFFKESAKMLQKQPWMSFFDGLLFAILTPILALILFATIIGIPLGLAVLLAYLVTMFFSCTLASLVFARWIELKKKKKWRGVTIFFLSLGIFIVLKLLLLIPILGWVIQTVFVLTGLGAVLTAKYQVYKKAR